MKNPAILPQLFYLAWVLFWAFANGRAIERANAKILHAVNGALHFAVCLYFAWAIDWRIGLGMAFGARAFFDTTINLVRKKGIGYVSPDPASIFDQAEKRIFGKNGILPKILYLVIWILLNYLFYGDHL